VFQIFRTFKRKKSSKNDVYQNPYSLLNRTYEVGLAKYQLETK